MASCDRLWDVSSSSRSKNTAMVPFEWDRARRKQLEHRQSERYLNDECAIQPTEKNEVRGQVTWTKMGC